MRSDTTCWTLIGGAASGREADRSEFVRRYSPALCAYFTARWRSSRFANEVDDACQEVFIECFREEGPLTRVDRQRGSGFRALLYGIARNVAFRVERRVAKSERRGQANLEEIESDEATLSVAFDRAWALVLLKEAAREHQRQAEECGADAVRRVELLKLRFQEELPIREIAKRWRVDATHLHREYAKARREYENALRKTVSSHCESRSTEDVAQECRELLKLIG